MAVKEQDVELIVRQILDQMSGSTAGAAPAAANRSVSTASS